MSNRISFDDKTTGGTEKVPPVLIFYSYIPLDTYTFIPFLRKKSVGLSPYCSL